MGMEIEAMKKILAATEKSIMDLKAKPDLSPQETRAGLDGMLLRELLLCEIENCKQMEEEYSERSYSRRNGSYNQYGGRSYGDGSYNLYGRRPTSVMYPGDYAGYDMEWMRPHDPMYYEGAFNMRGGRVPHGSVSTREYSRHSVGDRVVNTLEKMMDATESDYEREELHKFIRMIRQAAD